MISDNSNFDRIEVNSKETFIRFLKALRWDFENNKIRDKKLVTICNQLNLYAFDESFTKCKRLVYNRSILGFQIFLRLLFPTFRFGELLKSPEPVFFRQTFGKLILSPSVCCLFFFNCCAQKTNNTAVADYDTKNWTELTALDNTIKIDIRYATKNNFTKAIMYDCARCFLRPEAAKAIEKAHKVLKDKGYGGLKMFDCYRPRPYQQRLWDKVPNPSYVTPPWKGSQHTRGLAADLTIIDKEGKELDMGTEFDDFTNRAHTDNTNLPKNVLENRQLLRGVMEQVGFNGIRTEWWHFFYTKKKYDLSEWVWQCK